MENGMILLVINYIIYMNIRPGSLDRPEPLKTSGTPGFQATLAGT